jgi:hypothetical protein
MLSRAESLSIVRPNRTERLVRLRNLVCALPAFLAFGVPASAQISQDVTVNPQAAGSRVLLYPDGRHTRVTHPLLEPGETDPDAPIHLHMPSRHKAVHRVANTPSKSKSAELQHARERPGDDAFGGAGSSFTPLTSPAGTPARPPSKKPAKSQPTVARKPPPAARQAAKPEPQTDDSEIRFLSGENPSVLSLSPARQTGHVPASRPVQVVKSPQTASLSTTDNDERDLSNRKSILFSPGAEEPAPSVLDTVKAMSPGLNSAVSSGAGRIQLYAYGGRRDDKSSDARRLSLKRALIIRQLLIDEGVPSESIDTHAMGGATDGALDRVDVYVQG